MSVLIRGMEMPKACWECPLKVHLFQQLWCVPGNKVINREDNTEREPDCPLIEVQSPHGRLIDADALNTYDVSPIYEFCVMGVTEEDIELAETIIEAEGSDT